MREHGLAGEEILADLESRQGREPSVHDARLFGLVYPTGRPDLELLMEEVNRRYLFGNALNPFKFVELAADTIDLYAVADVMDDRNWNLNRNTEPRGLHLMLSPAHGAVVDELLSDLRDAVGHHGASRHVTARYS